MPASSSSSLSPSRERRKKKKESKKANKTTKRGRDDADDDAGSTKARKKKNGNEDSGRAVGCAASRQRPGRSAAEDRPNFGASGLLDEEEEDQPVRGERVQPANSASLGSAQLARNLAARSRSRDVKVTRSARGSEGRLPTNTSSFADQNNPIVGQGKGSSKGVGGPEEGQAPKEEPSFEASGLLGLEDNSKNGISLKFTVPPEARYPTMKWRLYIFTKQVEAPKVVHIHRLIGVLFGKDRRVVDVPTDHPTCSKQHAVLHYRLASTGEVKPYIMDLESTNGTFLNGERLEPARYYEMRERDVLKFGMSSREFVLLHTGSANHIAIDPAKLRSPSE
mmetsp:Transcript_126148/g.315310  ORF Transcript_126148/g.315310 Transcript_126148/m.315310 type:complete len:336 (-) Transcript_126148:47-1054(-)